MKFFSEDTNMKISIITILIHNSTFYSSTGFKRQKHKHNYKSMLIGNNI